MPTGPIERAFPLTPLQEGMLYHTLREPDAGLYHVQCTALLDGELDEAHLRRAWELAVRRHPALRTHFAWAGRERPLQVVRISLELDLTAVDWRDAPAAEQETRWRALLVEDRRHGLDLARAPVMRLVLARVGERRHRLLWAVHHALVDGWSALLVLGEVVRDHATLVAGGEPGHAPAASFDHFVGWQQAQAAAGDGEAFWRRSLAGLSEPTPLPCGGRPRAPGGRGGGERVAATRALTAQETTRLRAAAGRLRVTVNTLLMGAWALLLARHAGADDVMFGVTASERPPEIDGVERAVGLYLGTVPVRCRVPEEEPLGDWLRALQRTLSEARAHGGPGLAAIGRWCDVPAGTPLFESLVVFENFPADAMRPFVVSDGAPEAVGQGADGGEQRSRSTGGATGDPSGLRVTAAAMSVPNDVPLVLLALPGERLTLTLLRDPAALPDEAAERLLGGLVALLVGMTHDGARRVQELSAVGDDEQRLLARWSTSATQLPEPRDVVARFEACAARRGEAAALRTADQAVGYAALDRHANRLANRLLGLGVGPGALVGILAERSPELVAALLATLKAGAAYVPLDPEAPVGRLLGMAEGLDVVLASPPLAGRAQGRLRVALLDDAADESDERPDVAAGPDQPAYVLYTSGSTGEPKGVVVERRHIAASTAARDAYYPESPASFLLLSSPAVDSAAAGIYWTLCTGGALVLPRPRAEQDLTALARLIEEAGVTHTLLVPSLHRALLEHADPSRLASLKCVVVAGEACPAEVVRLHRDRLTGVALHNEYGPTEATVWATADELTRELDGPVTIGRPVPGARVHLLDARLRPVPAGAPGEICIGGPFVARGYRDRPRETAERFVPDPSASGGRLYRTGDRGRFLADGRIEFLGRTDEQLKVRGFRVEPGEIERALADCRGVREAAVVLARPIAADVDALMAALLGRPDDDIDRLLAAAEAAS